MRQFVLELDDAELAQLEAAALALHTDPVAMVKAQLFKAINDSAKVHDQVMLSRDNSPEAKEARRQARLAALSASRGIWAGEPNKPKDGVFYQDEMREEWP